MQTVKWLAGMLVVLVIIGIGYQFIGMVSDRIHYSPPGRMIDVGGHRLHLYCIGNGSPTVVLESPAPGWSLYWTLVQPEVAKTTRVCAYDRAGLGWSDPGPLPRTGQRMAQELHRLLDRADVPGPYILVGHSLGGLVARLYREDHRKEVVGMVLVDAGHELELREAEFRAFVNAGKSALPFFRAMTILGLSRLFASFNSLPTLLKQQEGKVPEQIRPMLRAGWLRSSYPMALRYEAEALAETLEQVRRTASLGDLPLVVLTAAGPVWWPEMPDVVNPVKFKRMWLELQRDLLKLSAKSQQVLAEQSSHFIQFDQPGLIVEAIQRLVNFERMKSAQQ